VSKTQAMSFADHGIATHIFTEFRRDLAGAQALDPELGEEVNPLTRPSLARIRHNRLQTASFSLADELHATHVTAVSDAFRSVELDGVVCRPECSGNPVRGWLSSY